MSENGFSIDPNWMDRVDEEFDKNPRREMILKSLEEGDEEEEGEE